MDHRQGLRHVLASEPDRPALSRSEGKSGGAQLLELVLIVAVALGLALGIQALIVKPYRIPSPSMVPTLQVGQRVLVNRIGNEFNDPQIGDILVFHPPMPANKEAGGYGQGGQCGVDFGGGQMCPREDPREADVNFIKRVVAGPGDTVAMKDGHAVVNGVVQKEPFINPCGPGTDCNFPKPITVPPDHWFMMGDNRGASDDSRYWGPVPRKWIIGRAFATYWPLDRLGLF